MSIEIKKVLEGMPAAKESYPFGKDAAVFKVSGKVFAILFKGEVGVERVNLKCDPDQALALRDIFSSVIPGYHMNKKHWNTVILNGEVPSPEIQRMVEHSYALVIESLKKTEKLALRAKYGDRLPHA